MKAQLTRISIFKSSIVFGITNFLLAFVIFNIIFLIALIVGNGIAEASEVKNIGLGIYAFAAPLIAGFISMFAGIFSFLLFLVFGSVYNLVARGTGGFEFNLKQVEKSC